MRAKVRFVSVTLAHEKYEYPSTHHRREQVHFNPREKLANHSAIFQVDFYCHTSTTRHITQTPNMPIGGSTNKAQRTVVEKNKKGRIVLRPFVRRFRSSSEQPPSTCIIAFSIIQQTY